MVLLSNWQKDLDQKQSLILITLFIFLFIFYECILFSRLSVQGYLDKALDYLEKSRSLDKQIIIEKSLLYYQALKLVNKAASLNPYDSRPYFEYAQIITEIGDDTLLSGSLDIKMLDAKLESDGMGFYGLAKTEYVGAILREPTNAIYHQKLGAIYDKLSDTKSAEEEFKKAVLLSPQNLSIYLYLSQYFFLRGKAENFLYHIQKAIALQRVVPGGVVGGEVAVFLKSIGAEDLIRE